jgi:hypothetical protein
MMMNNDNDDTNNNDNDQLENNNEIEWEEFMVDYWKNDDNNNNSNTNTPSNNVTSSTAVGGIPNGTTVSSHPLLSYIDKETNREGERLISSHDNDNNATLSPFLMMLPCELSPEIDDERIYNALSSVRLGCMDIDMDTNSSNSNRGSTADYLYYNNNNSNAVVLSQQFLPNNNHHHHHHHTTSSTNIDILSRVGREFSTIALLSWSTATAATAKNSSSCSSSSSSSGNYEIQIADEIAAVAAVGRRMKQGYTIDLGVPVRTSPFTLGED